MKIHKNLKPEEAILLGFKPKENEKGRNTARYYITIEQNEFITELRQQPNKREFIETQKKFGKDGELLSTIEKLQSEPIEVPEGFEIVKISTSKTTGQQWVQYKPKEEDGLDPEFDYLKELK